MHLVAHAFFFCLLCANAVLIIIFIIGQSTTIDYDCNLKVIYFQILTYQQISFSRANEKTRRLPKNESQSKTRLERGYFGTYSHYDAHPLAFIGEGEYLQDGEVQYLATRGP